MSISPRPHILATTPDAHGAPDYAELATLGLDPEQVLDFSVNSNPYGPSPHVTEALAQVQIDRYPDRESLALRRALAERLSLSTAQIVVGNGTTELLWLLAFSFLRDGDPVLVLGPTFGEYARCARLMGGQVVEVRAELQNHFAVEVEAVIATLQRQCPRVMFLCNPNNPTGGVLPLQALAAMTTAHPETLFVVDEAYLSFVPDLPSALTLGLDNMLVLRSMTKDYAIAGLRLGYVAGPADLVAGLVRARPAWNVNAAAQAVGLAALKDEAHLAACLSQLRAAKADLLAGLRKLGLVPVPSATHYFIVEVGDAAAFRQRLLLRGIQVRNCSSFGLPRYIRIATRRPAENERLLAALQQVMSATEPE